MDIKTATNLYETWVRERVPLLEADLRLKHQRMAESPFPFLRATFYRWSQVWPEVCAEIAAGPKLLAVGDIHVENFGTWRDSEGRLIWGVNDFDEVEFIPYTNDLVRLAVSARLAISEDNLSCDPTDACDAVLEGYRESLTSGGRPFVLAEQHRWLRELAHAQARDHTSFWQKLNGWPTVKSGVPHAIKSALKQALPEPRLPFRVVHRQAGLGSLGRRRFTALAQWRGGWVAREAKELRISAWHWEKGQGGKIFYQQAIDEAVRVPDPFVRVKGQWVFRRLAPDCSRLELGALPESHDELKLLHAMGWEVANIHLGTRNAVPRVLKDLNRRPAKWLRRATQAMMQATLDDWKTWAKG
jgi:hypothetical protein